MNSKSTTLRRSLAVLLGLALLITVSACGNGSGNGGEQTVDLDGLDVDFDTLDVDVNGADTASQLDTLKQDTIGGELGKPDSDVAPDVAPPECVSDTTCADASPCTEDHCQSGKCVHVNTTGPCDDGSKCTLGDLCKDGACLPGAVTACNDGNVCTDDSCDVAQGCLNLPNVASCTDNNKCTVDGCNPVTGLCTHKLLSGCTQ